MTRIISNRITGRFTVACNSCGLNTTPRYAGKHNGRCKACTEGLSHNLSVAAQATREEQQSRYIDCGPAAWDDR
jgi:tRNA(Ile2) C34 agmatinyltransferase TiaS